MEHEKFFFFSTEHQGEWDIKKADTTDVTILFTARITTDRQINRRKDERIVR